jgi:two-component system cell cycle response regulator
VAEAVGSFLGPRDQLLSVASDRGELLVAKIRLLLTSTLLLIPISSLLLSLLPGEGVVGLAVTTAAVGLSLVVYLLVRRGGSRPWLGLATSCLDVTLVSAALATFLVLNQPHTAVNSKVVYEGYFLAIGATCLRYDRRACVAAGLLAVVEYGAIALIADTFWRLNSVALYAPFIYGAFSWSAQVSRMILLLTASALSFAVVTRTQELVRLSTRDPLTGLFNRGYFHESVAVEVSRAERNKQPLTIAMIDVDHFKSFNDTHGHAAGDLVLQTIAGALRRSFRKSDIVSRYGGEEFVIAMPDTDTAAAGGKLEGLRRSIEETLVQTRAGKTVNVTISAGLAGFPTDGTKEEELLAIADARLFQAKRGGRNRIVQVGVGD